MSILYEKTRLRGRMLRGGYEGEGTDLSGGFDGAEPGSGWGGSVGGSIGGKPGEDAMAHAASQVGFQRSDQQLADAGVAINGLNPVNSGQTAEHMQAAKNVGGFLNFAAPAAMSAVAPGFGMMMGATKTANNLLSGMPIGQVVAGYAGGFINSKLNEATGGLYGKAQMAGGLAKSMGVDVPNLNAGKAFTDAAFGPSKSFGAAAPATAATSASDFVAQGIDSEGWTKRVTGEAT